jgi:hypothetical protein
LYRRAEPSADMPNGWSAMPIFAAIVKIHQSYQALVIPKLCFGYNAVMCTGNRAATGRCVPIQNGALIVVK